MEFISLYAWTQQHGLAYSRGQKFLNEGKLEGVKKEGSRWLVPVTTLPPVEQKISCLICGKLVTQITSSHLNSHDMTVQQYKDQYPHAQIVTTEISDIISAELTGRVVSEETCRKISENRTGVIPQNHPRFIKGAYSPSDEARKRMGDARRGKKHSEETKKKIGDGNRGKIQPPDAVVASAEKWKEWLKTNPHPMLGKSHDSVSRQKMSDAALLREANIDPVYKARRIEAIRKAVTGRPISDQERVNRRNARIKYLQDNPDTWRKFTNTKGEVQIKEWLEANGIRYIHQFWLEGHPYDFALPDYNIIVEFDGPHHWNGPWWESDPVKAVQIFDEQLEEDAHRNMIAGQNGFAIIRLRGKNLVGDEGSGSIEDQISQQLE